VVALLRRSKPPEERKYTFGELIDFYDTMESSPGVIKLAAPTNGTSYKAAGSQAPAPASTKSLGSGRGGIIPDRVPAFASRSQAIRQYEFMTNDDAAVDISLRVVKTPILAADFFVEAGDDTPLGTLVQEFVEYNILHGLVCPWVSVVEDFLRAFDYGVSVAEKIYEPRVWAPKISGANRKQYTMLKDIAARPTPTLTEFKYDDNGYLLTINQNATKGDGTTEIVELPVDQVVVFTNNRKGGNLEGKSVLRTAYKHWYYKNNLYSIDGIQKERHGMGYPIIHMPQGYTDKDIAAAMELLRNIRTNEEAGAALPPGWILEFAKMEGQPVDVLKSIDHHNGMILLNVLAAFSLAGVSDVSGFSRGTSASSQDIFTKSLRFMGNLLCEQVNKSVIPQLVDYNFQVNGVYPKLGIRNIGETKDLQQLASAISNLLAQNAITMDYDTEQWFRKVFDIPLKKGGVQTPDANATSSKGNVQTGNQSGNIPEGTNPPK
jgi:hypothetical protein